MREAHDTSKWDQDRPIQDEEVLNMERGVSSGGRRVSNRSLDCKAVVI